MRVMRVVMVVAVMFFSCSKCGKTEKVPSLWCESTSSYVNEESECGR